MKRTNFGEILKRHKQNQEAEVNMYSATAAQIEYLTYKFRGLNHEVCEHVFSNALGISINGNNAIAHLQSLNRISAQTIVEYIKSNRFRDYTRRLTREPDVSGHCNDMWREI